MQIEIRVQLLVKTGLLEFCGLPVKGVETAKRIEAIRQ